MGTIKNNLKVIKEALQHRVLKAVPVKYAVYIKSKSKEEAEELEKKMREVYDLVTFSMGDEVHIQVWSDSASEAIQKVKTALQNLDGGEGDLEDEQFTCAFCSKEFEYEPESKTKDTGEPVCTDCERLYPDDVEEI